MMAVHELGFYVLNAHARCVDLLLTDIDFSLPLHIHIQANVIIFLSRSITLSVL